MADRFDFVIFGSGFGGSIMSMILRRLGRSVLLLERGKHPRFAIGESSTPFANLLLEQIAAEYDLPFLRALSEWGSWQKQFPDIGCGLKRGFTFYHHRPGELLNFADRERQLLVGASPNDVLADTHWYRPDFDHLLVRKAQELGVTYLEDVKIEQCDQSSGWKLKFETRGQTHAVEARFAIDATGPNGFLAKHLGISECPITSMPETSAVYAHFRDVPRFEIEQEGLPYPAEDAAVHHVFGEGWIWVLRFNNGLTSAGAAIRSKIVRPPEQTWNALLRKFPTIARQFAGATAVTRFYEIPRISFRRKATAGADWVLLPATAGFVDPLLSTGFALNLLGIWRLGKLFGSREHPDFNDYERQTFSELDAAAELVGAMYQKMDSFQEFVALSLLYFAAMSFTETAWRLDKGHLASMFLLCNDARFTDLRRSLCRRAQEGLRIDLAQVAGAIEPWDIAGLGDLGRRNFYPVMFEDLMRTRGKLGATEAELRSLFAKLGVACEADINSAHGNYGPDKYL